MNDPSVEEMQAMSEAGVGLVRIGHPPPPPPRAVPDAATLRSRRRKGTEGEQEWVREMRRAGWPEARRQPASGAIRPYGAQDRSPWPFDVTSGYPTGWSGDRAWGHDGPWLFEVKRNRALTEGGVRTWRGSTFVLGVLREVSQVAAKMEDARMSAGMVPHFVAAVMRPDREPWQVWVPARTVARVLHVYPMIGSSPVRDAGEWLMFEGGVFLDLIARAVLA